MSRSGVRFPQGGSTLTSGFATNGAAEQARIMVCGCGVGTSRAARCADVVHPPMCFAVSITDLAIRRAIGSDSCAVADVWLRSVAAALPTVRRPHTDQEVRAYFHAVVIPKHETWVAVAEGSVVGLLVLDEGLLSQLYLDPLWRGQGIGDQFVRLAKKRHPDGLQLRTFQVNGPAQRFYERHGFIVVERTDGSGNEEHEPDIRYVWRQRTDTSPVDHATSVTCRSGPLRQGLGSEGIPS